MPFMKKIHVAYLVFFCLALSQCTELPETFSTYEVNPLKKAIVENNVTAYLEYVFVAGKIEKADSVSFDLRGNVNCRIAKGGLVSEQFYTYDSLNRLIFETQRSDIFYKLWTQYELAPEAKLVVKYIRIGNRADSAGELFHKEILKFDRDLSILLTKTDVNLYTNDTTITKYDYDGDRIVKELEEVNRRRGRVTDYIYENGRLVQIRRQLVSVLLEIDYFSKITGLIDSTSIDREGVTRTLYYKYYRDLNRPQQNL